MVLAEATALEVFSETNGLDSIVQQAKDTVAEFNHDLSTDAGRKRTASLASKVAKLKVKLDNMGKESTAELKAKTKLVDGNRKAMRDELDELKVEARKPLTDWEAEQAAIKAEEEAKKAAEELAAQIESDHEIALLLNEKFDRELAEKIEAEKAAIKAREDEMKRQAAEAARIEAENKAKAEQERIEKEKAEAIHKAEEAERQRIASEERAKLEAEQARINAEQAEKNRLAALEKAKKDAEQAAENARIDEANRQEAERQRIEEETAEREANRAHVGKIRKEAKESLMDIGLDEETAKNVVLAISNKKIKNVDIKY